MKNKKNILFIIVIAQFCSSTPWFVSNGVMGDLVRDFGIQNSSLLTSSVQFGFILGTLLYALFTISDRFSPSKVFFLSAVAGALVNLGLILSNNTLMSLISLRLLTGFFLAGIYPVGMKIASDYYQKGLGKSLGLLVGALVLGTAFPHILKDLSSGVSWKLVIIITSSLTVLGGLLLLMFVPDGPYRKAGGKVSLMLAFTVFNNPKVRSATFGYFGHMWELYTFWAFIPTLLLYLVSRRGLTGVNISLWSFFIIAAGGVGSVLGGYISQFIGVKRVASISLILSGACCLLSPLLFYVDSSYFFIGFLLFWGMSVTADSPQFSTLISLYVPSKLRGTALTLVNSIGFALTIISIQTIDFISKKMDNSYIYMMLALGPILGLLALLYNTEQKRGSINSPK